MTGEGLNVSKGGRPSIRDIAAKAGVSVTTVSHTLNRVPGTRVAESTRRQIEQVAQELGYVPNGAARSLKRRRSESLALISDDIATTPYAGQLILGAQQTASRLGYVLLIMNTAGETDTEKREIEAIWQHQVDGVLYARTSHQIVSVPESLDNKPVVVVNSEDASGRYPSIFPDERQGGYAATRLLIEAGHRTIGMLNAEEDMPARDGRLQGYKYALKEAGIRFRPSLVVSGPSAFAKDHYEAAQRLLSGRTLPTGIFCFNDRMAMGLYRAAREAGLSIPDDLSVVGFDNQDIIADALAPGLTTLALPYYEMGALAVESLVAQLDGNQPMPHVARAIPSRVVTRGSVRDVNRHER